MATLEQIAEKIDTLSGDMTYRRIIEKELDVTLTGRRANRDFVVKSNVRTLRSGPNRGKVRVDGAVIVMFGQKDRTHVNTCIVRKGEKFLSTLDKMAQDLGHWNQ